jgi:hypothetical protein
MNNSSQNSLPPSLPPLAKNEQIHVSKGTQTDEESGETSEYVAASGFWGKKGDFAAYFATPERADDSVFKTTLMGLLSGPPQIMCTATVGHFSSGEYAAGAPYAQRSQLLIKAKPGKFDELITNFDDEALGLPFTARQKGFMEMSHSKVVVDGVECLAITGFWKEVGD